MNSSQRIQPVITALAMGSLLLALAGCETTGDPQQGGLFGWSEDKARARQEEKRSHVSGAESQLSRETAQGEALQSRQDTTDRNLATAAALQRRTQENLRGQQARLVTKTEELEASSPTAATASRARSYRLKVNTIVAQTSLSAQSRAERLHALEAEIDAALARSK